MKKLPYTLVLVLSLLISINVSANIVNTQQSNKSLSDQYLERANAACKRKDFSNVNVLELLQKAAEYDNAKANFALGMLYFIPNSGIPSIKQNNDLAIEYMLRADQLGYPEAKKPLITFKLLGLGRTSTTEILNLRSEIENRVLKQTSNTQKIDDLFNLLSSYESTKQKELRNINKTEYYANQLASLPLSQFQKNQLATLCIPISVAYQFGIEGCKKDPKKSFEWMKMAADLGKKQAYYNLSDMYFYGYGTPVNFSKSYEMTKLGDQLTWPAYDLDHTKHIFPLFYRPYIYLWLR